MENFLLLYMAMRRNVGKSCPEINHVGVFELIGVEMTSAVNMY